MRAAHARLYAERAPDYGPLARHALAHFPTRDPLYTSRARSKPLPFVSASFWDLAATPAIALPWGSSAMGCPSPSSP